MKKRLLKISLIVLATVLAVGGMLVVKEYLLLRKIERAMLSQPASAAASQQHAAAGDGGEVRRRNLVARVARDSQGDRITAYVNFAAFRKTIEANPDLIARWGSLRWKVLDDTPALCIRNLASHTPFAPLGVAAGDCITHLDGESVNQPMRNLAIWLSLARRERLTVDTLRGERKISYTLIRQRQ